ncbi:MAG: ABC transporter ATP-binding protein [Parachlamydiaceae bacterium]|nr:ABC transporter ATP-binding protein [Parachlamydiaceae bacterium]
MPPILSFENVDFAYSDSPVLKNVSFNIKTGESIGIIGPNGGGKTTLLKLIMGFLKPTSGTISLFGKCPPFSVDAIGYVPQVSRFDRQFPISVFEVVLSGRLSRLPWYGRYRNEDYDAANAMLEKVGLSEFQNCAFGTLSGGQAQRTLIARALVSEPKLLLLDEPTASVDVHAEAHIYQLLRELQGNITLIMVTHDLSVAIDQVQRVLCVQGSVSSLMPKEVCEHFALGLYHTPLIRRGNQ